MTPVPSAMRGVSSYLLSPGATVTGETVRSAVQLRAAGRFEIRRAPTSTAPEFARGSRPALFLEPPTGSGPSRLSSSQFPRFRVRVPAAPVEEE